MNVPNWLSLARLPLGFLFCVDHLPTRIVAIFLALATDYLDGHLARKYNSVTRLGTILDPITDRIFVLIAFLVLIWEGQLPFWVLAPLFARDMLLLVFWIYCKAKGTWETYQCRATLWGKVTTVAQLFLLLAITLHIVLPPAFFLGILILGALTFFEVLARVTRTSRS